MAQIVDINGNPLDAGTLREPQTANVGWLNQTFAGHPSRGLTPGRLAAILEAAEYGDMTAQHDLFLDMEEKDAHLYAEMGKRKRALLTLDWAIQPPPNPSAAEKKAAKYAEELIRSQSNFDDMLLDMMDAVGHGFSCLEYTWQRDGSEWIIDTVEHRPQSWFQLDKATRSTIHLRDGSTDGTALNPFGWAVHVHKAKSGYLSRAGLYRVLAWPYLFKNYGIRDFAELLEIYGLPIRIGKYPASATQNEKETLLRAVLSIGHDAGGIIPQDMAMEFVTAAAGGGAPHEAMVAWAEKSVSKAVLGGTLTSQADGKTSTNALGNVHNEIRHDLLTSDATQLAGTLTRDMVWPLLALNGRMPSSRRRCPRLVFDTSETVDLALYADALPKLSSMGMRIPLDFAHERLRIPLAAEGEPVLGEVQPPATKPAAATGQAALSTTAMIDDPTAPLAGQLTDAASPAWGKLLDQVSALVAQAPSLETLREQLLDAYGGLPTDQLTAVMTMAFACAELAGLDDARVGR
ncbi:DUF935 domain-containing protein [Chitinimonas sp.]|uniref:DUF935 domain-containing protein n=1 Tax=Chitinimonas sp. TaxID=1934313 RepID=UPI0035B1FF6D